MSLVQTEMIATVEALAAADENVSAVLMYGSFIKGEGDQYSDVEFYIFHRRDFDHRAWVEKVRPLRLFFTNEFGTEVAVFDNLIRGEFHFSSIDEIDVVKSWEGLTSFEHADRMPLVDKDGRLAEVLAGISRERPRHDRPDQIVWLAESLLNNLIMVDNIIRRGDLAHAQQGFQFIQKYLIWLIRLADGADTHWENPSKNLRGEISADWYRAYAACVPTLEFNSLQPAFTAALEASAKLFERLEVGGACGAILKDLMAGRKSQPRPAS